MFAVVLGLGLVIWELQQVRVLARAQLTSDFIAMNNAVYSSVMGENAAEVVVKGCLESEKLTPSERLILDNYFLSHANLLYRMVLLTDRDGLYPSGYWQDQISILNPIVNSEYGRAWFYENITAPAWSAEFISAGHNYIVQIGPPTCETELLLSIESKTDQ